ncbi:MAG: hypothetical protein M1819_007450 [Sarea resinae]|nr:MAG: hypothetical protein M1819_007450 [Sarea resinae]
MDYSPSREKAFPPPVAGVKRPAPTPSLLPAFEPRSSSPSLPRPTKRQASRVSAAAVRDSDVARYPTPLPSSAMGNIPSSPPPLPPTRPTVQRAASTVSERSPLSAVAAIPLPSDGRPVLMGRSSHSSDYQLSGNRLISRVHVRATFIPSSSPSKRNKVVIECVGWNGVKVHCQGRTWELAKGDNFTSETQDSEIMMDVHDARVLIVWPPRQKSGVAHSLDSESSWDEEESPSRQAGARRPALQSSPPPRHHLRSPVSPSPAHQTNFPTSSTFPASDDAAPSAVHIYEDPSSSEDNNSEPAPVPISQTTTLPADSFGSLAEASQSSSLSELQDFSDRDEENDPIIHSFGPFGDNLLPRMASFTATGSPQRRPHLQPLQDAASSPQRRSTSELTNEREAGPVANHVINQLAFSRLSSTPLSTILHNLPSELKGHSTTHLENRGLSKDDLRKILHTTKCVGEVIREGKDAAGKPLESEYYYIPDLDSDDKRREAVVEGLKKPGLRSCRKQHKVSPNLHFL